MYRFVQSAFCLLFLITPTTPVLSYFEDTDNWFQLPHPEVVSFTVDTQGNASGFVAGGIPFKQYTILDTDGLRVQRFEIENHFHFIVNGNIVYSVNDLSTLLAQNISENPPV